MESLSLRRLNLLKNNNSAPATSITIVGGAAVDVLARTKEMARKNNSNIGFVEIKYGGVSRNVAECITRLGYGKGLKFITSIGKGDSFGHLLMRSFEELGMRTDGVHYSDQHPTAVFWAVMNLHGGLEIGVNDMDWLPNLPLEHIQNNRVDIEESQIVVVDANMSPEIILETLKIAINVKWTIWEPVSAEKSKKLLFENILPLISILKPNDDQFEDLFNLFASVFDLQISKLHELSPEDQFLYKAEWIFDVAKKLSQKYKCQNKLRYLVVTWGSEGVKLVWRDALRNIHFRVKKLANIKSANGAGDSFHGGFITGLMHYKEKDEVALLSQAIKLGSRCSALTIMSTENISHEITSSLLNTSI